MRDKTVNDLHKDDESSPKVIVYQNLAIEEVHRTSLKESHFDQTLKKKKERIPLVTTSNFLKPNYMKNEQEKERNDNWNRKYSRRIWSWTNKKWGIEWNYFFNWPLRDCKIWKQLFSLLKNWNHVGRSLVRCREVDLTTKYCSKNLIRYNMIMRRRVINVVIFCRRYAKFKFKNVN